MATFEVFGNHGTLSVDCLTGLVLSYSQSVGSGDTYSDITQFDVTEYLSTYPNEISENCSVDILDIGYWYMEGSSSKYEPPDSHWRAEYRAMSRDGWII